jgi:acetyl-CoA synthetase
MEDGRNAGARRVLSSLESWWPLMLLTTPLQLARWRKDLGDLDVGHKLRFSMVASSGDMLTPRLATFGGSSLVASEERLINLWSQSETGVPLIATYPYEGLNRKGALGLMTLGVDGQVLSDLGEPCRTNESGQLVFCRSWPAMIRGIWNQQDRFQEIYFQRVEGCYSTNDGMRQDREGFYWFMRRLDDVVKVRGSSVATSEVECAMLTHPDVKEAAVLGLAGEGGDELVAFVSAEEERVSTGPDRERLEQEIHEYLRERVGEFFVPTRMYVSSQLPRTRSGKIVRRLLRRIATGDVAAGEDLSHVANPRTVESLMENTSPKKE